MDISETRDYYNSLSASMLCGCSYCRNYRSRIRNDYPKIARYLESFGVDIEKPFETSPLEPDQNGIIEYICCQYIVFGKCDAEYNHRIDEVEFRIATSYPSTGIERPHYVVEFYPIRLLYTE